MFEVRIKNCGAFLLNLSALSQEGKEAYDKVIQ